MNFISADSTGLVREVMFEKNKMGRKFGEQGRRQGVTAMCLCYKTEPLNPDSVEDPEAKPKKSKDYFVTLAREDGSVELVRGDPWSLQKAVLAVESEKAHNPVMPPKIIRLFYIEEEDRLGVVREDGVVLFYARWLDEEVALYPDFESLLVVKTEKEVEEETEGEEKERFERDLAVICRVRGPLTDAKVNPFTPPSAPLQLVACGELNKPRLYDISLPSLYKASLPVLWESKNVHRTKLDLEPKIEPSCLVWIAEKIFLEGTKVAMIRCYDITQSPRCMFELPVNRALVMSQGYTGACDDNERGRPLFCAIFSPESQRVYFGHQNGFVLAFSCKRILAAKLEPLPEHYTFWAGRIKHIEHARTMLPPAGVLKAEESRMATVLDVKVKRKEGDDIVMGVGPGRFAYVWRVTEERRRVLKGVYMRQKLTCCELIVEEEEEGVEKLDFSEDEEEPEKKKRKKDAKEEEEEEVEDEEEEEGEEDEEEEEGEEDEEDGEDDDEDNEDEGDSDLDEDALNDLSGDEE